MPDSVFRAAANELQNLGNGSVVKLLSNAPEESYEVTATKLIELRNGAENSHVLLVLIPSNLRTAAEDSFDRATFKQVEVSRLAKDVIGVLEEKVPIERMSMYKRILGFFENAGIALRPFDHAQYLLNLEMSSYEESAWGKLLFHFGLIPDTALAQNLNLLERRLNQNVQAVVTFSNVNQSLVARIQGLDIEQDSLQKDLFGFLQNVSQPENVRDWSRQIAADEYKHLDFSQWPLVALDREPEELEINALPFGTSKNMTTDEDGYKRIVTKRGREADLTVKFETRPSPMEMDALAQFRIDLMRTLAGGEAEKVVTLCKFPKPKGKSSKRSKKVKLDANLISEGTYFLRILGVDESGLLLNRLEGYKDPILQKEWEERLKEKEKTGDILRDGLVGKLTCDTEDFTFRIEDSDEDNEDDGEETRVGRRPRVDSVLKAVIRAHTTYLQAKKSQDPSNLKLKTGSWTDDGSGSQKSCVFEVSLDDIQHNYQIRIPTILRDIEWSILQVPNKLDRVKVELKSSGNSGSQPTFRASELDSAAPETFLSARIELFEAIFKQVQDGNGKNMGIVETADVPLIASHIEAYVASYVDWMCDAVERFRKEQSDKNLQVIRELVLLDHVECYLPLPSGKKERVLVATPLHPLRLAWLLQLSEVFSAWESEALSSSRTRSQWSVEVASLFDSGFQPSNQVLLIHGGNLRSFCYIGELSPGWGFYSPLRAPSSPDVGESNYGRTLLSAAQNLTGTDTSFEADRLLSVEQLFRYVERYLTQHPYTETLILNLFNPGSAERVAKLLIALQQRTRYRHMRYEIRLFANHISSEYCGQALEELLNPTGTLADEAEEFVIPSRNPLFPKVRFSRRTYEDYLENPQMYEAHFTVLLEMFSVRTSLLKQAEEGKSSIFCHGLISDPATTCSRDEESDRWTRYLALNSVTPINDDDTLTEMLSSAQVVTQTAVAFSLAGRPTDDAPGLVLSLDDRERTLIHQVHQYSDWVITLERGLGVDFFDAKREQDFIPYLLDYAPGTTWNECPLYLSTRPSSEVNALLAPQLRRVGLDKRVGEEATQRILEAIRSVSGSVILQLTSCPNLAFEALGIGLTRLLLERIEALDNLFIIPLDVHRDLFQTTAREMDDEGSRRRGDLILLSADPGSMHISIQVVEVKCRGAHLGSQALQELKESIGEQLGRTVEVLQSHFDPAYTRPDRVDRSAKNRQFSSLLEFYANRAFRFDLLEKGKLEKQIDFSRHLDRGYSVSFSCLGIVFEFDEDSDTFDRSYEPTGIEILRVGRASIQNLLSFSTDGDGDTPGDEAINEVPVHLTEFASSILQKSTHRRLSQAPISSDEEKLAAESGSDYKQNVGDKVPSKEDESQNALDKSVEKPNDGKKKNGQTAEGHVSNKELKPMLAPPEYSDLLGDSEATAQYGILGMDSKGNKVAFDLTGCNTVSLFGVPGAGKSYSLGSIVEMALRVIPGINSLPSPLAGVIFHYNESQDYPPEFVSMRRPNSIKSEIETLRNSYGAEACGLDDLVLLTPADKLQERKEEYPDIQVLPLKFSSSELSAKDWRFLMGAVGNQSLYLQKLNSIMKKGRNNLTLDFIQSEIQDANLTDVQRDFAVQRLELAEQFIDDSQCLGTILKPGRLVIIDLRDEFIEKDQALGLFVVLLSIFAGVKAEDKTTFNKLIVFDEAHKYLSHSDLTSHVVEVIRQMRHQGVTMLMASQDPPSLPNSVIELSSALVLHRFNSPQWLKHVQKSVIALQGITSSQMASLQPGEAFVWSNKATHPDWTKSAVKINTRPRATMHGGSTQKAVES